MVWGRRVLLDSGGVGVAFMCDAKLIKQISRGDIISEL